ncbi:MAG: hypothetical protein ABIO70_08730 [Pseudomonadota bacterium]
MPDPFHPWLRSSARAALVAPLVLSLACHTAATPQRLAHAEVKPNLNGIRAAQIAYFSVHHAYVEITEPVPRAAEALDPKAVPWPPESGFDQLDWAPSSAVTGTYWIELTNGGEGFVAHAMIDADGDHNPAHYTATREAEAKAITPEGVF